MAPYPDLISTVVMPARSSLVEPGAGELGEFDVARLPRRGDGDIDPARLVRRAGHPGRELGRPVAGEHQMGVAVDEPGDHTPAAGVDPFVGRWRRTGAYRRHAVAVDHDVGVGQLALGRVGDEQSDAVDGDRAHVSASRELAGDVDRHVTPIGDHHLPTDDDVAHVGGRRREHRRVEGVVRSSAGQPHRVEPDRGQVGERAGLDPAGVGPAEGRVTVLARHAQQRGRVVAAPHPRDQPLVELDRPGLLEQVDDGVGVAAQRDPHTGVAHRPRRADAVGQIALGGRAQAARTPPPRRAARGRPRWHGCRALP